jgi:peptide/nickel transport system substrate-binding protein
MGRGAGGGRALRWGGPLVVILALLAVAFGIGAGGSQKVPAASGVASGLRKLARQDVATFALPPGARPDDIFPLMNGTYFSVFNSQYFQYFFYRPLYYFGSGQTLGVNNRVSLAYPPVFSDDDQTVTVTLKPYQWSDGQPVTARDVQFWQNLVTANKGNWGDYSPGLYPDDIITTIVTSPTTIVFELNKPYNPTWFLENELSQITPLPQQVMDKTSANGPVGNYDETPQGAVAVYDFLANQAKYAASYTRNPLWSVIDGPWKLFQFDASTGRSVFVPNAAYSGPVKPQLKEFVEEPFTSDRSELGALEPARSLSVGYLPWNDLAHKSALTSEGYRFNPWVTYSFNYFQINQAKGSPLEAVFSQTYVRQALQLLVNEHRDITDDWRGYAVASCGPVPVAPPNPIASSYERGCPLRYDPAKAASLLRSHGWHVVPGGTTTCDEPAKCGAGVEKGARLSFSLGYSTGITAFAHEVDAYQAALARVGIKARLKGAPFDTVVADAAACLTKPEAPCTWSMEAWGSGWVYTPDDYPTGEALFETGAAANYGQYSDPTMTSLIEATTAAAGSDAQSTMDVYQSFAVLQVPYLYVPNQDYQLTEVAKNLKGVVPQNAYLNLLPEDWYYVR